MRKQRTIKIMRKFLNLTITLMILFISIYTAGCGAKDDYIEGYGEDEYIEYSDSEYYEEPQNNTISDKDINKILMDEMPLIPICHRVFTLMLNPKLKGIVYNPLGKHKFNYCYIE